MRIQELLVYSIYGLTLSDRNLCKIMGKQNAGEFLNARENYYEEQRHRDFSHPDFPMDNLNELVTKAGGQPLTKYDTHTKRVAMRIQRDEKK